MSELVMKKYVASYEGKCKKKSGQEYWDNIDFIYCFTTLNYEECFINSCDFILLTINITSA